MKRARPTLKRVRELLAYDPISGALTWKVSRQKAPAGRVAGHSTEAGYRLIGVDGVLCAAHRLAWLLTHGRWPKKSLDHIDGNPSNNAITNLREASGSQNSMNKRVQSNNKFGFKGVHWNKQTQKWHVKICVRGKSFWHGYFDDVDVARRAYAAAARKHHGEFARTE